MNKGGTVLLSIWRTNGGIWVIIRLSCISRIDIVLLLLPLVQISIPRAISLYGISIAFYLIVSHFIGSYVSECFVLFCFVEK